MNENGNMILTVIVYQKTEKISQVAKGYYGPFTITTLVFRYLCLFGFKY